MLLIPIDNLDDPRLEPYRNLKSTNLTRRARQFVVEGDKLVRRLIESDYEALHVLAGESYLECIADVVPADVPVYVIPTRMIDELIGFQFHRGVLACGRRKESPRLKELFLPLKERFTCIVCPDVTDPENLGAILRMGAGFGVDLVLLGARCGDPFSRRVLRVSMGNAFRIPIVQSTDLEADVDWLVQGGVELAATVLDSAAEPLHTAKRSGGLALLFGNEGDGLSSEWIARAHRRITIPMENGTDSLNVAIAAGIFLHHFTRPAGLVQNLQELTGGDIE